MMLLPYWSSVSAGQKLGSVSCPTLHSVHLPMKTCNERLWQLQ